MRWPLLGHIGQHRRVLELQGEGAPSRTARRLALEVAAEAGVDSRLDDFAIVVSELVMNAVDHGAVPIRLVLSAGGCLFVSVADAAGGEPVLLPASATRSRGRGLALVEDLSDRWGIVPLNFGKVVWAEIDHETTDGSS
ncbi:MAG: ATP-binding protein [Acidimicrobiia bacterium]|nr:ATP-binding protein [Acidimicrobiia bacterium]